MGAIEEAAGGSDRDFLVALRDHLATVLDGTPPPHTIAGLTKQLLEIRQRIKELDSLAGGDALGDAMRTPDEPLDPLSL